MYGEGTSAYVLSEVGGGRGGRKIFKVKSNNLNLLIFANIIIPSYKYSLIRTFSATSLDSFLKLLSQISISETIFIPESQIEIYKV